MYIYVTILVSTLILSIFSSFYKVPKIFYYLILIILFIVSGFRAIDIGYDYAGHYSVFQRIANNTIGVNEYKDPGYAIFALIVSRFGGYEVFTIVYSFILLFLLHKSIKHLSVNQYTSIFVYYALFFLGNNMAKIRQAMAVVILLYSITFLLDRFIIKFYFTVFIATLFHFSSIVFVIVPFLIGVRLDQSRIVIGGLFFFLLGQLKIIQELLQILVSKITSTWILNLSGFDRFESSVFSSSWSTTGLGLLYNGLFLVALFLILRPLLISNDFSGAVFLKLNFWGICFSMLFYGITLLSTRLLMGFFLIEVLTVPLIINNMPSKIDKVIVVLLLHMAITTKWIQFFSNNFNYFVPYRFFF